MKKIDSYIQKIVFTGVAASLSFASVNAQEAEEQVLEELIVTAQKRAETTQSVPISITAINGDQLNEIGIDESDELGQFIPGLEISTSSGEGSQLITFLRGAGLNDYNTNNAGPIGIYSDEVYISSPALTAFQFFDTQRVEVLKGPQGTLYGRNTTGGAIKFISKKPTLETDGYFRLKAGNFGMTSVEGALSLPLSDTLAGRVAMIKSESDGYVTNLVDGSAQNGNDSGAYRAFLKYEPNDQLSILANFHGAVVDSFTSKFNPLGTINPATGGRCDNAAILANQCVTVLGYKSPDNPYEGNFNPAERMNMDSKGGYLQVDYIMENDVTFTSVTSFDELDRTLPEETDATPNQILEIDYGVDSETFSQELRLSGEGEIDWLLGGFYMSEDLNQNQGIDLFRSLRAFTGGLADPTGEATGGAPIFFARLLNNHSLDTFAVFGQMSYAVNESLNLTIGGRYTDEERSFTGKSQFEEAQTFGPAPIVSYSFDNLKTESDAFSYRLALDYSPSDTTMYYASISRGFKSGGFNGGFLAVDPRVIERQVQPYDPEFVTAYELGMKSDFADGRMRFNAAVFYNDFSDLQVFTQVSTGILPVLVLDNASDAESKGLEFELVALVTDGLTFSLNGAFISSELKNFQTEAVGGNYSGNQIANTPEKSLTAALNYDYYLSNGGKLNFISTLAYKDDLFFTTENSPLLRQEAHTLVNARVGYLSASEKWGLSFFVNNLTDEFYLTNATDSSDITASIVRTLGMPKNYGVEFNYNF